MAVFRAISLHNHLDPLHFAVPFLAILAVVELLFAVVLYVLCKDVIEVMFQEAHSSLCSVILSTLHIWPWRQWSVGHWLQEQSSYSDTGT